MDQTIRDKLQSVLYTLGLISVCGKDNLDRLLGCMQAVETILKEADDGKQDPAER